ncbi:TM2 domain-containing protein [Staphylococcus pseudoxylosus]|uniref:TM2 domain-containing protein n=1 Tax=Staphylococcus pseudoxylosus TaxID=2282419 RepID=UPI001BDA4AD4|nr:TM2 domain-containing protein [Staphylococcus pseudoxylosus]
MNLDEASYIEQQVTNRSKSAGIAYLLWFFFGSLGGHRFYFGKTGSAIGLIAVTLLVSWWTFGIPTFIWVIIDAFLIPSWKYKNQQTIRKQASAEVKFMKNK